MEAVAEDFLQEETSQTPSKEPSSLHSLPEDIRWKLAQDAVCTQGFSQKEAADKYGLSYENLRKKCQREAWPVIEKVAKLVPTLSHNAILTAERATNWSEKGELHRALAFKVAQKAMQGIENAPPEVKDWADVERVDKLARRAAGLDTSESTVSNSFNFMMLGERMEVEAPVIEIPAQDVGELPE